MDKAAPHAASADEAGLPALRFGWDEAYEIGWDAERGYWARRLDGIGGELTAADPDELRKAIYEDYSLKPVPRPASPGSGPLADS
jgi:hypothetical protein